jgi:hypothetical protein
MSHKSDPKIKLHPKLFNFVMQLYILKLQLQVYFPAARKFAPLLKLGL